MLARSYQAGSRLGQFLDPLADKVLVLGTFAMLAYLFPHIVPWWGVAIIAIRDLFVTGLRVWTESRGRTLRTLPAAKAKTTVQLTFLILTLTVLVAVRLPDPMGMVGSFFLDGPILYGLMLLVVVITAATGLAYLRMEYHEPTHPPLDG